MEFLVYNPHSHISWLCYESGGSYECTSSPLTCSEKLCTGAKPFAVDTEALFATTPRAVSQATTLRAVTQACAGHFRTALGENHVWNPMTLACVHRGSRTLSIRLFVYSHARYIRRTERAAGFIDLQRHASRKIACSLALYHAWAKAERARRTWISQEA